MTTYSVVFLIRRRNYKKGRSLLDRLNYYGFSQHSNLNLRRKSFKYGLKDSENVLRTTLLGFPFSLSLTLFISSAIYLSPSFSIPIFIHDSFFSLSAPVSHYYRLTLLPLFFSLTSSLLLHFLSFKILSHILSLEPSLFFFVLLLAHSFFFTASSILFSYSFFLTTYHFPLLIPHSLTSSVNPTLTLFPNSSSTL